MDLVSVRTAEQGKLPWANNSIYKFSAKGRYPEIIIKIDGKLFIDMDAFRKLARRKRDEQIAQTKNARRGVDEPTVDIDTSNETADIATGDENPNKGGESDEDDH